MNSERHIHGCGLAMLAAAKNQSNCSDQPQDGEQPKKPETLKELLAGDEYLLNPLSCAMANPPRSKELCIVPHDERFC